ncbi:hypothetical protein EDB83DRAFT_2431038 [Lactarius deliciosus]|nr:hypothetical protein EDB83DRAFT_2431038 [Lactarius deliciosus]
MNAFCLLSFLLNLLRCRPVSYSDEVLRLHAEDTPELGNVVCSDDSHLCTFWAFSPESASLGDLSAYSRGSRCCGTRRGI